MNTIRMTAINTENARSRTHERAPHKPEWESLAGSSRGAGTAGFGLSFSCIPNIYGSLDGRPWNRSLFVIIDGLAAPPGARLIGAAGSKPEAEPPLPSTPG